ncbi:MAG: DNA topoisomerase I [Anaerolineae bacterium]
MLQQLIHNGIVIPEPPPYLGLSIVVRGRPLRLEAKAEEMAVAFARKKDTVYVQDATFVANFMADFSAALGVEPVLDIREVDLAACYAVVEAERLAKEQLTKEERKALAAERKAIREDLKARYGFAIVNGQRVELGAYMAEPSGIFMGRGEHPLRGRWKEGARHQDVTLNLSPDAPTLAEPWGEIVWQPESMWVARWVDKLSGKQKYIWLSDTAPIKQQREASKFDKAIALSEHIALVREQIARDLAHEDKRRRMIATACYLIDALCLRVGDEKDPDEADTVGATTLRPEHVTVREDGIVAFQFLGKDSVEWNKELRPPEVALRNLKELVREAKPSSATGNGDNPTRDRPQLFPGVSSHTVNVYLSSIQRGLTAKVFRTYHATTAVRDSLDAAQVKPKDPDYLKWQAATLANLEAARLCNHTKQATGNWEATQQRFQERRQGAEARLEVLSDKVGELTKSLAALKREMRKKVSAEIESAKAKTLRERYRKRVATAQARLDIAKERRTRAQIALGKIHAQAAIAGHKRTWNLSTSLKSYIDPRVYHRWGAKVGYDVLGCYYPTILQRKFAWVRVEDEAGAGAESDLSSKVTVRTCMSSDLMAVAQMFEALAAEAEVSGAKGVDLPRETEEIARRFLPALGKDWQEAVVALGEEHEVIGLAVIGPLWEHEDSAALDIRAYLRPEWRETGLPRLMADEVYRRLQAYQLHHPGRSYEIYPRERGWLTFAEAFWAELSADDSGEEDLTAVDEPEEIEAVEEEA